MQGRANRVLLIEEDDRARRDMCAALSGAGFRVHELTNGSRLPSVLTAFVPDAVIVDTSYRLGPSGLSIARFVRTTEGRVVLFAASDDGHDVRLAAFAAGADNFLAKPIDLDELIARLRSVLLRAGLAESETLEFGDIVVHGPSRSASRAGAPLDLTPTQFDLLVALARNPGRVMSKAQLLAAVWSGGTSNGNLVEVHISALRRVLEEHGPPVITTVRGGGYRLQAQSMVEGLGPGVTVSADGGRGRSQRPTRPA